MTAELLILSDIRFVREGLTEVLGRDGAFRIAGAAADIDQACSLARSVPPRVILIDTSVPDGVTAVRRLRECAADAKIVAFALRETESEVISWAQAGIHGYIPRDTPITTLVELLNSIVRGEQTCRSNIASGMLRWIAQHAADFRRAVPTDPPNALTTREEEVADLMGASLTNKEIARRLGISLATTKSHVHSILAKLGVRRRALAADRLRAQRLRLSEY